MGRLLVVLLSFFCTLMTNAQIKTQREYDYVGTEINNAGLRVVGVKILMYTWKNGQKDYIEYYGCIDKNGNEVIPLEYKRIELNKEWNYIIIQKYGGIQKHNGTSIDAVGILSDDGKRAIISSDYYGIPISPRTYMKFKCTIVITYNYNSDNNHYGIVNNLGDMVVSPIYEELYWIDEENGILAAKLNGKWGVIDYKGKEIVAHEYKEMNGYNGFVIAEDKNRRSIMMNANGNVIIPLGKYALSCYNGWVVWAEDEDKYALINTKGEIVLPFKNYGKMEPIYGRTYKYFHDNVMCMTYHNYHNSKTKFRYFDDDGHEHKTFEAAEIANKKIRIRKFNTTNDLAILTWLKIDEFVQQSAYVLQIGVKSDSKIEDISISVNGGIDRGLKTVETNDYDLTINKTIKLTEGENVIKVSVTNAAGTTQEEKTIVYRPQGGELPSIEWIDFAATANKKEYQMKLGIKSKTKVEEVNVTVNGALTRGIKPVLADGYDMKVVRTLALSEGVNRIVVSVRNGDGIATSEKVITYQGINPTPIFNDKRIAFVVGNSHYSNSEMNLANPENDAKDVAEKLKGLGFEVVLKLDATKENMEKELSAFGEKAKDYDVAMFYYAGHGIQSKGVNYLIPTNIEDLAENNLNWKCVNVEQVLDVMEDSQCKLKIVVLDACRNDPISRKWHRSAGTRGLSIMSSPIGTIIAYSTAPGMTAMDGTGRNSPYTEAFLNTLDMPNLDVSSFFQEVMSHVTNKTHQAQNPWWSSSYTGKFYFNKQ